MSEIDTGNSPKNWIVIEQYIDVVTITESSIELSLMNGSDMIISRDKVLELWGIK